MPGIIGGASSTIGALTGTAAGVLGGPLGIAGASLLGTVGNAVSQGFTNRAERKFAEEQADKQRAWALEDWNRNNEYNSPSSQMARLKAAGLNPNLVYGNGATTTAAPVRSSETAKWSPHAPQVDASNIGQNIALYYDVRNKAAQTDNIKAQTDVIKWEARLKEAQYYNTWQGTHEREQNTDLKSKINDAWNDTFNIGMEGKRASINKLLQDISYSKDKNSRENQMNQSNLEKNQAIIENLRKDGKLKALELQLGEMGVNKNDPAYMRILIQAAHAAGILK